MTDMMSTAEQYEALAKLLHPPSSAEAQKPGPALGPSKSAVVEKIAIPQPSGRPGNKAFSQPANIWEESEILHQETASQSHDNCETPSFEFVYKQAVESTDAFLGMMNKDPSSTCCEDLQLRVDLPKTKSLSELDLDVQATKVLLTAPTYVLALPLPHKIDEKQSSAKWDSKKKQLILTMRIVREW